MDHPRYRDHVQCAVHGPVATPVQPMPDRVPERGWGWGSPQPSQARAASLRTQSSRDHAVRHFAALIALNPFSSSKDAASLTLDQLVQLLLIGHELLIQFEDMFRQASGLVPGNGQDNSSSRGRQREMSEVWEASVNIGLRGARGGAGERHL
jgi:hypothetical protein